MKKKIALTNWGLFFLFLLILVLSVVLIIMLLNGNTSIKNSNGLSEKSMSLTCEENDVQYPFLAGAADNGMIKINGVFNEKTLDKISLIYKVHYDTKAQIERSETRSRIMMNESFSKDGLNTGDLGSVFSMLNDAMQFSLQVDANEINGITAKYFLLDGLNGVHNRDAVMRHYVEKGFNCHTNN